MVHTAALLPGDIQLDPSGQKKEGELIVENLKGGNSVTPLDIEKIGSRYLLSGLTNFGNFKTVPPIVAITEKGDYDEEFKVADITNGSSDTTIYKFTKAANNKLFIAGEFSKVNDKFQRSITRIDEDGDPDFCDVKKSELRHPKGLRFFVKKAPTGDYVPNSLIASKTSPHHSYDEIKVVR